MTKSGSRGPSGASAPTSLVAVGESSTILAKCCGSVTRSGHAARYRQTASCDARHEGLRVVAEGCPCGQLNRPATVSFIGWFCAARRKTLRRKGRERGTRSFRGVFAVSVLPFDDDDRVLSAPGGRVPVIGGARRESGGISTLRMPLTAPPFFGTPAGLSSADFVSGFFRCSCSSSSGLKFSASGV